jgi:hypothetical protein
MADIIGMYSGIRPFKGASEPTFFTMNTGGMGFEPKINNVRDPAPGLYTPLPKHPDQFTPNLQTKTMNGVLHCKGQPEAIKYGRPQSSLTEGMYPATGYARHQKPGLATDFNKPMDRPIMPLAGFYNPDALNTLGSVRG